MCLYPKRDIFYLLLHFFWEASREGLEKYNYRKSIPAWINVAYSFELTKLMRMRQTLALFINVNQLILLLKVAHFSQFVQFDVDDEPPMEMLV